MKLGRLIYNQKSSENFRAGLLLLCGFFLLGLLLGNFTSAVVTQENVRQLQEYLLHYAQVMQHPSDPTALLLSLLTIYFRYPLLLLFLGFSPAGLLLIPIVCLSQAFFLSFSVCCFAKALGKSGVLLALRALGVRCLFTVPCTLCLAMWAASNVIRRMNKRKNVTKQDRPAAAGEGAHLLGCLLLLLLGVIIEFLWVPDLVGTLLIDLT